MAAIQAAPAIGQLLIGENSLFSGKKRLASRELKKNFDASQAAGINKGYYDVLGQQAARANQGLGGASLGLARMEQGRAMAAQLGALGGRRSALAGLPGLGISSNDFATRLAASNEMAQRQNQATYEGTQLQVAGLEDANAQRKRDEAAAYWGNQRQESDASISSALKSIGDAAGSAFAMNAMKTPSGGLNLGAVKQDLPTAAVSSVPSMASLGLGVSLPKKTYGAPLLGVTPKASSAQSALSNFLLRKPLYGG